VPSQLQANKIDEGCNEPQQCNSTHDRDVSERISVKLKSRGLGKEHRSNKSAFRSIEARSHGHGKCNSLIIFVVLWAPGSDYLGSAE
jgi:hypothetical protein